MKLTMRAAAIGKKITLITTAFILAVSTLTAAVPFVLSKNANALGEITISSVAELRSAIENQADGQVWNVQPGSYGLSPFNSITAGGQTGWYFPITADNLTINGVGNPTVYGTGYTANGNWSTQNLVSVFGDDVTINGFTFMPKVQPNKTIEVLGEDFTLRNSTFAPNSLTDQSEYTNNEDKEWGGSLYFNHAGNHTIENVTIQNGGVSFRYSPTGTHIALANVKIENSTAVDWINGYRFSSGFNNAGNSITGSPKVTYHVTSALGNAAVVAAAAQNGDTISLDSDISVTKQLSLAKSVTLNGNGHTITGNYVKTDGSNNSVVAVLADNVKINNLTVDGVNGNVNQLHGINVYDVDGVELTDITAKNGRSGVGVNRSAVTINGVHTSGNVWHGVNIDQPGAVLTIKGVNTHTEPFALFVDNRTVGQVIDVDDRYDIAALGNADIYTLDVTPPAVPVHVSPAANVVQSSNDFLFDWNDVQGAVRYELQNSTDPATSGVGTSFQNVMWTGDYQRVQPTVSQARSVGANGTWYWQVRAIDAAGNASAWSTPWKVTIDKDAPSLLIASPANGEVFGGLEVHASQKKTITVQATGSDSNGLGAYCVKITKVGSAEGSCVAGGYVYAPANGAFAAVNINTTGFASGEYVVKARLTDKVSNATEVTRTISIDNTKPVIATPITEGQTLSGTVAVDLNSTELNPKIHNIRVLNASGAVVAGLYDANAASPNASLAWNTRDVANGTYKIQFSSRDAVGNSAVTIFRNVVVDNDWEAPVIGLASSTESSATPTIGGTINDPAAAVKITLAGTERDATNNGDGTWSYTVPSALVNGEYPISVFATDTAGNPSSPVIGTLTIAIVPNVAPGQTDEGSDDGEVLSETTTTTTTATVTPVTPAFTGPTAFAAILGTNTTEPTGDDTTQGTEAVEGTSAEKNLAAAADADNSDGTILGMAWYWWLLILAGIATIIWWIIATLRGRAGQS